MSFACEFFRVSDEEEWKYRDTYPAVNVQQEFQKMETWLWANPQRRKKQYRRFIVNWLAKCHGRLVEAETAATSREIVRHELERMKSMGFHTEMYFKR